MGPERLELSHIAALDPKSSASTNFATGPRFFGKKLGKKLFIYWSFAKAKQSIVCFFVWQSSSSSVMFAKANNINLSQARHYVK